MGVTLQAFFLFQKGTPSVRRAKRGVERVGETCRFTSLRESSLVAREPPRDTTDVLTALRPVGIGSATDMAHERTGAA